MPRHKGPRGAGNPKFTIYAPLVPKMHHIKFEKNWSSGYQEEVKNVQMLTDHMKWPRYRRVISLTIQVGIVGIASQI